jgi:hypothetical protein
MSAREVDLPLPSAGGAFNKKMFHRTLRAALAVLTVIVAGVTPRAVLGQNSVNQCIDRAYSSCSAYATASSAKQACVKRYIDSYCNKIPVNPWGAIAYSKPDEAAGWAYEQADKQTAENIALQNCRKQGGAQCQVVTTFERTCGSVAADHNIVGAGTAGNRQFAEKAALAQCAKSGGRNCSTQAWVCSAQNTATNTSPATPSTPRDPNAPSWGAIAYSSREMSAGHSQGKADRASAEREAMSLCAQRGKECAIRSSFNKQCGALAADGSITGSSTASDQRQALAKALDECKRAGGSRCVPHVAFCSF